MIRTFSSPQTYIQGPGVLRTQLNQLQRLGGQAVVVTDEFVKNMLGDQLTADLKQTEIDCVFFLVDKQAQDELKISLKKTIAATEKAVFVIGLGGGRAIDSAKTLADAAGLPIAVLPTSASMDAPTSRISVIYDEQGVFQRYDYYPTNPEVLLVDTEVIFAAPGILLAQGIADGLATYIEARAVWHDGGNNITGGKPTFASWAIAEKCRDVLFDSARQALTDQKQGILSADFEAVVEANILLSGLGFENGGLSLAHGFHNVIMGSQKYAVKAAHGEIVAVGLLIQLAAEGRTDEFMVYHELLSAIGMPVTLAALGIDRQQLSLEQLAAAVLATGQAGNHIPLGVGPSELIAALETV